MCADPVPSRHSAAAPGVSTATGSPSERGFTMNSPKWAVDALVVLFAGHGDSRARAADATPSTPTLVARVKSLDGLIADAKYVAGLAGLKEQATQFEKMIPAFLGPKGVGETGVDPPK